jgi:hypothetical protein
VATENNKNEHMKFIILSVLIINTVLAMQAQNVGIGTASPATRLDVAGVNGWDLVNGEGDMRIGSAAYRLKFGIALGGGGAGAAGIMQTGAPGGYNVLSIGSQGNYMLQLNGTLNRVGIGTDNPEGKLDIRSSGGLANPQLLLYQSNAGDYARMRIRNANSGVNNRYWDMAGFIASGSNTQNGDFLNFFNSGSNQNILSLRGDGVVAVNNTVGGSKWVLASNGAGVAGWQPMSNVLQSWYLYNNVNDNNFASLTANGQILEIPNTAITLNVAQNARLVITALYSLFIYCGIGCETNGEIWFTVDGNSVQPYGVYFSHVTGSRITMAQPNHFWDVGPGDHTIRFYTKRTGGYEIRIRLSSATVIAIPR